MQNAVSLKTCLNIHKRPVVSIEKIPIPRWTKAMMSHVKSGKAIHKNPKEKSKPRLKHIAPQAKAVSYPSCMEIALFDKNDAKVTHYLATIEDPLWKHICQDVLDMMGPVSALMVWKSQLGPFSPQDKVLSITCENEETAIFVQQYDFVILGSIQKYFPALKQLKAKVV